jgi:ABC-type branched-subunit amino acid transport system substrate-binding protein
VTLRRRWSWLFVLLALASACSAPPGRRSIVTELDPAERAKAEEAYGALLEVERAGDASKTYEAGMALLSEYPGSGAEAHTLLITARAARGLGDSRSEQQLLELLVREYADSEHAVEGAYELAELQRDRGDWAAEADALVVFDARAADQDPRREGVRARILELLQTELEVEEVDQLLEDHPNSSVSSTAAWIAARRVFDEGEDPEEAGERLEAFLRDYPRSRYAEDARGLLAALSLEYGRETDPGLAVARADRIGLLAPLTGEYAALGQALFDGALLAVEEHNRLTGAELSLVSRDTRSDEVDAVLAARELIEDEGVIAIVGALLSTTTVSVATLCEERGVSLVSPTAVKETIKDLGPHVFQTNLTKDRETRLLVRVAVRGMLRERFAILHPDTDQGRSIADRFALELERQGGQVVATAAFNNEMTDFAVPIIQLRDAAPEAIFVPANANEMRLIAPQLIFHDLRAQLFGLSSWNNSLLLREAGASMEQAVTPSEVALIPEDKRLRFEELWRRRFPQTSSTPIALKSYMAALQVIDSLDPEGRDTRQRLRLRLEENLLEMEPKGGDETTAPLRVVRGGELVGLPVALFPGLAPTPEVPEIPPEDGLDGLDEAGESDTAPNQPGP